MGLGMSSPYLLFGLIPGAAKLLPRPGEWMVKFKEICGFILLATVVFMLTFLKTELVIPTIILLLGVGVGGWILGQWPTFMYQLPGKLAVWGASLASIGIAYCVGMVYLYPGMVAKEEFRVSKQVDEALAERRNNPVKAQHSETELPWQPFSTDRLGELLAEEQTVLVDFSADWCTSCKINEATALNTVAARAKLAELGAAALYADFTEKSDELTRWIKYFKGSGVPLTVVIPPRSSGRSAVVLDGPYTQSTLLSAMEKAGPSARKLARAR
jgi:thiol:disulfide interchange protein